MEPVALIERVERARSAATARSSLKGHAGLSGLSAAYFRRVVGLMGEDPAAARRLADRWKVLADLGDDPAQAFRIKGASERMRGAWEASIGSFQEAGRRAKSSVDALAYRVGEIESLGRLGRTSEALALARRIVSGLRRLGEPGLAARARLNAAAALLWVDDYRAAIRWLEPARHELERSGMEFEAAGAEMSLSTCFLHTGRPEEARGLAQRAREVFDRLGQTHMARLCDSNIGQVHLLAGRPDAALTLFLELRESFHEVPLDAARTEEFLGHAYLRLNMPEAAAHAFETALASPAIRTLPINRANCTWGLSQALRDSGRPAAARNAARRAQEAYHAFGNEVWRSVAQLAEAEALLRMRRPAAAKEVAERAREALRRFGVRFALAEAELICAQACLEARRDANEPLRRAANAIRRDGRWGLEWRLHFLRARNAPAGRSASHYRAMVEAIVRTRALIVSNLAKSSFLDDKAEAIGTYLGHLLAKPRPSRVAEALEVIRRTRAAALIDEALAAIPPALAGSQAANFEELRRELAAAEEPTSPGQDSQRGAPRSVGSRRLARRWVEFAWSLDRSLQAAAPPVRPETLVLASTAQGVFAVRNRASKRLGARREIEERLRWLRFELFAPLADPNASESAVLVGIRDLYRLLEPLWPADADWCAIAPDDFLWSAPWPAIANAGPRPLEPVMALSPSLGERAAHWTPPAGARMAIWGGPNGDLPHIEREIAAVSARFPAADVLCRASEIRRFLEGGSADMLHVACHARFEPDAPMFSYLEFPDGRIHAAEIARSPLRVSHVALSACDTGSLSLIHRHEPHGLVRAFLATGVETALASLWPLDDGSALELMKEYYGRLSAGENCVAALRQARLKLRRGRPHPYFWASVGLFGGYRT